MLPEIGDTIKVPVEVSETKQVKIVGHQSAKPNPHNKAFSSFSSDFLIAIVGEDGKTIPGMFFDATETEVRTWIECNG